MGAREPVSLVAETIATLLVLWLLWKTLPPFIDWAFLDAVWRPDSKACREAEGACWGFIAEKHRFILFGTYPYEQHWRPGARHRDPHRPVGVLGLPRLLEVVAGRRLGGGFGGDWHSDVGGVFGLRYVENERWGGLILTLLLTTFGIAFAFPLGILLALGRRSDMPVIRALCVGYIELIRGVPLISVLFMASVMLPLFLPSGVTIDKLLRAQIAIILFAAAYLAEVIRGGLQAIPQGQYDAAHALALPFWRRTWLIILPQALRIAVPALVNNFIALFKDTSLVLIIGLFDLLSTVKISLNEPAWTGFGVEAYLIASLVYFVFCAAMSTYSKSFEVRR